MDKLDKLTILSVAMLMLYAAVLLFTAPEKPRVDRTDMRMVAARQNIANPELDTKIRLAKNLMAQDNLEKTETLVNSLIGEFPYQGELFMLKGDLLMRRQQPVAAMYEYKEAIDLNPDFLDKKTRSFQGKKIRITVEEAMAAIESGLQQKPGNTQLKSDRKTVYYMKRKLAGSCG
jgi:tetratricopeptide (TPR) repeat protein